MVGHRAANKAMRCAAVQVCFLQLARNKHSRYEHVVARAKTNKCFCSHFCSWFAFPFHDGYGRWPFGFRLLVGLQVRGCLCSVCSLLYRVCFAYRERLRLCFASVLRLGSHVALRLCKVSVLRRVGPV